MTVASSSPSVRSLRPMPQSHRLGHAAPYPAALTSARGTSGAVRWPHAGPMTSLAPLGQCAISCSAKVSKDTVARDKRVPSAQTRRTVGRDKGLASAEARDTGDQDKQILSAETSTTVARDKCKLQNVCKTEVFALRVRPPFCSFVFFPFSKLTYEGQL